MTTWYSTPDCKISINHVIFASNADWLLGPRLGFLAEFFSTTKIITVHHPLINIYTNPFVAAISYNYPLFKLLSSAIMASQLDLIAIITPKAGKTDRVGH